MMHLVKRKKKYYLKKIKRGKEIRQNKIIIVKPKRKKCAISSTFFELNMSNILIGVAFDFSVASSHYFPYLLIFSQFWIPALKRVDKIHFKISPQQGWNSHAINCIFFFMVDSCISFNICMEGNPKSPES